MQMLRKPEETAGASDRSIRWLTFLMNRPTLRERNRNNRARVKLSLPKGN